MKPQKVDWLVKSLNIFLGLCLHFKTGMGANIMWHMYMQTFINLFGKVYTTLFTYQIMFAHPFIQCVLFLASNTDEWQVYTVTTIISLTTANKTCHKYTYNPNKTCWLPSTDNNCLCHRSTWNWLHVLLYQIMSVMVWPINLKLW